MHSIISAKRSRPAFTFPGIRSYKISIYFLFFFLSLSYPSSVSIYLVKTSSALNVTYTMATYVSGQSILSTMLKEPKTQSSWICQDTEGWVYTL